LHGHGAGRAIVPRAVLLSLVAACCAIPAIQPAAAAAHKKRLVCPQSWPEDANAALRKATFSRQAEGWGPDGFGNPVSWGVLDGDEMSCTYGNDRQLLITIPGKADHCYAGDKKHPKPGEPDETVYCTYTPTGDPVKDAVNPREIEPLTRASTFRGIGLGMTGKEMAETLQAKSDTADDDYQQLLVLPDRQQMLVGYIGHKAVMIEFRPPVGKTFGLYKEICDRFGFPENSVSHLGPSIWRGADGVRIVLYKGRTFGNHSYEDQVAFLLDGNGLIDLDRQLAEETGH